MRVEELQGRPPMVRDVGGGGVRFEKEYYLMLHRQSYVEHGDD